MQLLGLNDRRRIVAVVEYLVEINQTNDTVGDVMEKFALTPEEYRMCCDLAMPALRMGNMKGRFTAVSRINKAMRKDIKALYRAVKQEPGKAAGGVERLFETYCTHSCGAVFGSAREQELGIRN